MLLKLTGIAITMFSCLMWGGYMASREYFRLMDLRSMKSAFIILRSEIDYGMNQLCEAAYNVSSRCSKPACFIFSEFSKRIDGKVNVSEIWTSVIEEHRGYSYFLTEDTDFFTAFGKTLGYMDKDMQLVSIDAQLDYICTKISSLETSWIKSRKMYLSLGALGGLAVGILMI